MTENNSIKNLLDRFDEAKNELDASLDPIIESWVRLQVTLGKLERIEATQDFYYVEQGDYGITVVSDAWEETWQYGGREYHGSNELMIPFEYIEDSVGYTDALLEEKKTEKDLLAKKVARKAKLLKELASLDV